MIALTKALTDEHSDARFLIFDWTPEFIARLREYQQLIKDTPLLQANEFFRLTLHRWGCTVVASIDEGEACDGLIQAKWKVENDKLDVVLLDDSIDTIKGVEELRVSMSYLCIDQQRFYWMVTLKYEDGTVESPMMEIPGVEGETQT